MEVMPSDFSMENLVMRKVGGVDADQRDVGAVQRGDEGQAARGRQHLLRQHGGDGVRNGVVDVQHIQVVALGHFRHAAASARQ